MAGTSSSDIVIENLVETRQLLTTFAPDLRKEMDREIRAVASTVRSGAAGKVKSKTGKTAGSFRIKSRRGSTAVETTEASGAILEMAGRANPGGLSKQGASLIRTLDSQYGPPGRLMWATFDAMTPTAEVRITTAVARAEAGLQAAMDGV